MMKKDKKPSIPGNKSNMGKKNVGAYKKGKKKMKRSNMDY